MSRKAVVRTVTEYNSEMRARLASVVVTDDEKIGSKIMPLMEVLTVGDTTAQIMEAMVRLPPNYAYWALVGVELEEVKLKAEHDLKLWHADKYDEVVQLSGDKATEKLREAMIIQKWGKEYTEHQNGINRLAMAMKRLKVILDTLEMQKDMLQSVGGIIREDLRHSGMDGTITSKQTGSKRLGG